MAEPPDCSLIGDASVNGQIVAQSLLAAGRICPQDLPHTASGYVTV